MNDAVKNPWVVSPCKRRGARTNGLTGQSEGLSYGEIKREFIFDGSETGHLREVSGRYLETGACHRVLFLFVRFRDLKCEESVRVAGLYIGVLIFPD
jgi:hypothetical protein